MGKYPWRYWRGWGREREKWNRLLCCFFCLTETRATEAVRFSRLLYYLSWWCVHPLKVESGRYSDNQPNPPLPPSKLHSVPIEFPNATPWPMNPTHWALISIDKKTHQLGTLREPRGHDMSSRSSIKLILGLLSVWYHSDLKWNMIAYLADKVI